MVGLVSNQQSVSLVSQVTRSLALAHSSIQSRFIVLGPEVPHQNVWPKVKAEFLARSN